MEQFSDEEIVEFLKEIGVKDFSRRGKIANLYKVLGITPEVDRYGRRVLTPYELLAVPPQFRNGFEVPIIFAIKNKVKKIGRYTGSERIFYYGRKNIIREEQVSVETNSINDTIKDLKKRYKRAVFLGNMDEAMSLVSLIDSLTGGRAIEILGASYDYTLFYRRMKKQLMIDMFAHFFMTYLARYRNNVKRGIVKNSRKFKPYIERQSFVLSGGELSDFTQSEDFAPTFPDPINLGGQIQSVKIETDFSYDSDTVTKPKEVPVNAAAKKVSAAQPQPSSPVQKPSEVKPSSDARPEKIIEKSSEKTQKIEDELGFGLLDFLSDAAEEKPKKKISEEEREFEQTHIFD